MGGGQLPPIPVLVGGWVGGWGVRLRLLSPDWKKVILWHCARGANQVLMGFQLISSKKNQPDQKRAFWARFGGPKKCRCFTLVTPGLAPPTRCFIFFYFGAQDVGLSWGPPPGSRVKWVPLLLLSKLN